MRHLSQLMPNKSRTLVVVTFAAAMLCGIPSALSQPMADGMLFTCEVKQRLDLHHDGILRASNYLEIIKESIHHFTFDESKGTLRWRGADYSKGYQVIQKSSSENGLTAIRYFQGPAVAGIETIHIATYKENWPFQYVENYMVLSGTCAKS